MAVLGKVESPERLRTVRMSTYGSTTRRLVRRCQCWLCIRANGKTDGGGDSLVELVNRVHGQEAY